MKQDHAGPFCIVAIAMACTGLSSQIVAQSISTSTMQTRRGALITEQEMPQTESQALRTPPKTEVEKHEEKKAYLRLNPGPVYNPNATTPPPPQLRERTPEEKEERKRLKQKVAEKALQMPDGGTTATDTSTTDPEDLVDAGYLRDSVVVDGAAPARPRSAGTLLDAKGPGPLDAGQAENAPPGNRVVGAANAIACHPFDSNILYVGFTNGGIWKTVNAQDVSPDWVALTDEIGSLSIGDIEYDPTDATGNTLLAGVGRFSSLGRSGGPLVGLLRTTNGGANWSVIDGGGSLTYKNFTAVVPRGNTMIAAVNSAEPFTYPNIGIYRSTDGGSTFANMAYVEGSGLPAGRAYDLKGDPNNANVLYAGIRDAGINNGIYKSSDTGATWVRVSNAAMNSISSDASLSNIHIHVGNTGTIAVALVNNGRLGGFFASQDSGATWTNVGVPFIVESDSTGIGVHPGSQGSIHLSVAADPVDPNIVYVGGDRQPGPGDYSGVWPNSLGAENYSGRLFRGNLAQPVGARWQHLTHSNTKGASGGGTASNSAPHADSRDIDFDQAGRLVQGDDGGVYCRTLPRFNSGDWFSMQGTLQTTEVHDVDYDSLSNKIIAGTQDNGVPMQKSDNTWTVLIQGDGGDVKVDNVTLAGQNRSIRYTSFQNLQRLTRRTFNSSGVQVASTVCQLTPVDSSPAIQPQFYTPVELNAVQPTRLLIGAGNGIYESLDQGNTVKRVLLGSPGDGQSGAGMRYGGRKSGVDYPEVAYVVDGEWVYFRNTLGNFNPGTQIATGGDILLDVCMDSDNYSKAWIIDKNQVFYTSNSASNWSAVTGDLLPVADSLRCITFLPNSAGGAICVGSRTGVYIMATAEPGVWKRFGVNLPASAFVFDLRYNAEDDVLVAGTLGRGVWMMNNASASSTGSAVGDWHSY